MQNLGHLKHLAEANGFLVLILRYLALTQTPSYTIFLLLETSQIGMLGVTQNDLELPLDLESLLPYLRSCYTETSMQISEPLVMSKII